MSITRFAIEASTACGRAFTHTDYMLDSGERYQGLYLLETANEAQKSIDDDALERAEEGLDDFEEFVTEVTISADGSIVDSDGRDVLSDISMSLNLSVEALKACASAYYEQEKGSQCTSSPAP